MKNGKISVQIEDMFPLIKKSLYSDHDIFLREMVSNATDAMSKLKTIAMGSENEASLKDFDEKNLKVEIKLDEEAGTLTISDSGIGMTEEEIEKYINQVAFSGAQEFLEKFKDAEGIIGHFGLGFYSAFLVSKKVEILTRSYKNDSKLVKWTCDGTPNFTIEDVEDNSFRPYGTDIILYLDDESKEEFGKKNKIKQLLEKYCKFMPFPVVFGKKTKWDSSLGKQVDTEEDDIINHKDAIWTINPQDLKDEDYKDFYRYMYPGEDDPQFWIRLNVSEPFTLKGVLFFPKTKDKEFFVKRNKIQLYCNKVFVTDIMEDIVPDYMQLLFGVIDSPDIPLNVSRSYLQSDKDVKKISGYISKKVADKLKSLLKEDRKKYEELWDDLRTFINYGILTDDDFWDRIKDAYIFKDTEGKVFTYEEYKTLIAPEQTNKNGDVVILYTTDENEQFSAIESAKKKGYSVVVLDEKHLDIVVLQTLESKLEKTRFARVDSNVISKLIEKENDEEKVDEQTNEALRAAFGKVLNNPESGVYYNISVAHLGDEELPAVVSQNEWNRRMNDNKKYQSSMWFGMGENYNMTLNIDSKAVSNIAKDILKKIESELPAIEGDIDEKQKALDKVNEELKDVKWEDRTEEQRKSLETAEKDVQDARKKKTELYESAAEGNAVIPQIIDIGLLGAGKLKGENLFKFLKRSVNFIK